MLATVAIGLYGLRVARTTSDFLVASRAVSPTWNAAAIGGEYLSAASFLGVAGLILKNGVDMLWYPVGFAAGYLALLLFVAGPLRRSGAFTLPDFCELRLASRRLRKLAAAFVVFIGWLYLVPQMQGAGLTLQTVTGGPYALGALVVAAVVTGNVALGGMRAITFVQAFQYWLKLTALSVPVLFLILHWQARRPPATRRRRTGSTFRATTTVDGRARPRGSPSPRRPGQRARYGRRLARRRHRLSSRARTRSTPARRSRSPPARRCPRSPGPPTGRRGSFPAAPARAGCSPRTR